MKRVIFGAIAAAFLGANCGAAAISEADRAQAYSKLFKTFRIIEESYVDEINTKELVDKALTGLLAELDAHSSFLSEKNYQSLKESTKGEFGGLGITVGMKDKALTVIAPIEGTPAAKAGIKAGDVILKIDGELSTGLSLDDAVSKMRGKPGTKIELEIFRKGEQKPQKISLTRDVIKIQSVYAKAVEGSKALYLRITSFDENVLSGVKKALAEHPEASGAVIDLRNNPGGLLDQATELLNLFIKDGVLVSQKGRGEVEQILTRAVPSKALYSKLPLAVLVDGGSASASEIVSGSLQDHGRAIVVGEKTFGKGSVQVIRPISASEGIKLTVAKYYLPSGRTIQALGVEPDIIVHPGKLAAQNEGFSYSESELSKHLANEQASGDSKGASGAAASESKAAAGANDGKAAASGESKVLSAREIFADAQLKSALDALRVQEILQARAAGKSAAAGGKGASAGDGKGASGAKKGGGK